MRMSHYGAILGLLYCLTATVAANTPETLVLDSGSLRIGLKPASLETWQSEPDGKKRTLSLGLANLGPVTLVSRTAESALLEYPEKGIEVSIALKDKDAHFKFAARIAQTLSWPRQDTRCFTALIWPMNDGRYIPLDDKDWLADIEEEGAHDLGHGLALWGLEDGNGGTGWATPEPYRSSLELKDGIIGMEQKFLCRKGTESRTVSLRISDKPNPLLAAELLRSRLESAGKFRSLAQKLDPKERERLLGSLHGYLWGDAAIAIEDVRPKAFGDLAKKILDGSTVSARVFAAMDTESRQAVAALAGDPRAGKYANAQLVRGLNAALRGLDKNVLYRTYGNFLFHPDGWGQGISAACIAQIRKLGIDRARLTLPGMGASGDGKQQGSAALACARAAAEASYLFGVYDSYHSIHPETLDGDSTWETAQFNQELFETGAIQKADGTYYAGFNGKGRLLSPIAARPYFENRVKKNLDTLPMSAYFLDCDAAAEIKEDYNPLHPSSSEEDAQARLDRMAWLEKRGLVVGSEGGDMLLIAGLHVSEGLFGPLFTWEEPEYRKKGVPDYWGSYWPPEAPDIQFKPIKLAKRSIRRYMDPAYRIPLFQAVFHDAVVITNHWSADPLKFAGMEKRQALFRSLYLCAPSYNLSRERLTKQGAWMAREYRMLLPFMQKYGDARIESFACLDGERMVQRCGYAGGLEIIANFSGTDFRYKGIDIPAQSAAFLQDADKAVIFTP